MQHYVSDTGNAAPRASFASSGLLSTQILNGAPFEIFLSADRASVERLSGQSLADTLKVYAQGELYLVVPKRSALADDLSLSALAANLSANKATAKMRLAIPNPKHAPYGRAPAMRCARPTSGHFQSGNC
jgi:molybdate transport system substrate-binding protein